MSEAHMRDFVNAVREKKQPACPIEEGFRSTATVQLGMIAYDVKRAIEFDAAKIAVPGNPQAQALLKREYRKPWVHPFKG
jgi:hypothetical protein